MIERSRFKYTPLHKTFEKQIETIENKSEKQAKFQSL